MESPEPDIINVLYPSHGIGVDVPRRFTCKARETYPSACKALEKHDDGSLRFWNYVHDVFEGADHARAWRKAREAGHPDPNEARRREDLGFLKDEPGGLAAGRKFVTFLKRWPEHAAMMAGAALLELKIEDGRVPVLTRTSDSDTVYVFNHGPGSHTDVVLRLLSHMLEVPKKAPLAKFGRWLHRHQVGPLAYPSPVDEHSRQADAEVDGLLFGTVLLSRRFTARARWSVQPGTVMPTPKARTAGQTKRDPGRPLWGVAAALVSDALGVHLEENAARNRLNFLIQDNPGLCWIGWPPSPANFFDRYF